MFFFLFLFWIFFITLTVLSKKDELLRKVQFFFFAFHIDWDFRVILVIFLSVLFLVPVLPLCTVVFLTSRSFSLFISRSLDLLIIYSLTDTVGCCFLGGGYGISIFVDYLMLNPFYTNNYFISNNPVWRMHNFNVKNGSISIIQVNSSNSSNSV